MTQSVNAGKRRQIDNISRSILVETIDEVSGRNSRITGDVLYKKRNVDGNAYEHTRTARSY